MTSNNSSLPVGLTSAPAQLPAVTAEPALAGRPGGPGEPPAATPMPVPAPMPTRHLPAGLGPQQPATAAGHTSHTGLSLCSLLLPPSNGTWNPGMGTGTALAAAHPKRPPGMHPGGSQSLLTPGDPGLLTDVLQSQQLWPLVPWPVPWGILRALPSLLIPDQSPFHEYFCLALPGGAGGLPVGPFGGGAV